MVTLVSYYPQAVDEFIPFMYPSRYHLEASDGKRPQCLTIGPAFYVVENRNVDGGQGLRVEVAPETVAQALVRDFRLSCAFTSDSAYPAVFMVPEPVDEVGLMKKYAALVAESLAAQKTWFEALVRIADDEWQRYRLHRVISDLHRLAARQLGLKREWLEPKAEVTCPACGTAVAPTQVICHTCRAILNEAAYKTMKLA